MAALQAGTRAPEFTLPFLDSGDLKVGGTGTTLLVFFKVECPVCQYAMPYFERLWQQVKGTDIVFAGVGQNEAATTREFLRHYKTTFPVALDAAPKYVASNAYRLTNVPTIFLIEDGTIEASIVSWSKPDIEDLARRLAERANLKATPLFRAGEDVAAFKPG